ncbi:hypothetical protein GCM10010149_59260 [Nonomuraea roseoviolacea subsp. roseoviolacea]|uniref:phosphotransferase family protein n=1 Tax=Nonomuraea roseoviolacea TaxID=103837 RepID=UPI0031D65E04
MPRSDWNDLPSSVRDAIQERTGPVLKAEPIEGRTLLGCTARLYTGAYSVFLKAVPSDSPAAPSHRREQQANRALPPLLPVPRMLWYGETSGWVWSTFDYIDGGRHANLAPDSPELPDVLATVNTLGQMLTPAPGTVRSVGEEVALLQKAAEHMLAEKGSEVPDRLLFEAALDGFDVTMLRGLSMVHFDLAPSKLLMASRHVYVLDWSSAGRGAPWLDAALLVPRLIQAGHTPSQAEHVMRHVVTWRLARTKPVTGFAALWTLYRVHEAQYGPAERRVFRARAAAAGHAWLRHRLTR